MALSLPAVVGAVEATAGGQAGSAVNLKPRCCSSFDEQPGRDSGVAIEIKYGVTSIPSSQRSRETSIVFCRKTSTTNDERPRSAAGLRKLSKTPNQTRDFAGRATSRARPVRHLEAPIRNLEAGIGQEDIGRVTPTSHTSLFG